jgi:small subunit ribosomal protein S20
MANIKSQIKRNRQNETRRLRNKGVKAELRTRIKTASTDATEGSETAAESLRLAIKRLDQAASKGMIHKNQAANRKSKLVKRLTKVSA